MSHNRLQELAGKLKKIGEKEGGMMLLGKPARWYEKPHWRCVNNHVSTTYLKSEAKGGCVCLACYEFVVLTFPEDIDGSTLTLLE